MKCKDIRELLKSDYLDLEPGLSRKDEIKEHLAHCPECRAMEEELRSQRLVFNQAERFQPPERVWQNIREAIVSERMEEEEAARPAFLERLRTVIGSNRPVFAVARVMAMMVFAAVMAGGIISRQRLSGEEATSRIFSDYSFNSDKAEPILDMGTDIEEYFL